MKILELIEKLSLYLDSKPLVLFFIPFVIYMSNGREIGSGDQISSVMVAIHLSAHGTVYLDHLNDFIDYKEIPYFVQQRGNHLVSNYPLLPGIMAAPLFAPAYYSGMIREGEGDLTWRYVSKISGAFFTAMSVVFLFYSIRMVLSPTAALILSYSYGLGTALWPVASQSLWQHGPGLFWITLAIFAIFRTIQLSTNSQPTLNLIVMC